MSMSLDALFKLAKERAEEEEAKPLEQRRREYRQKHGAYWEASEEGKLCLEFYRAYTAYKEHLQEHSRDWREGNDTPLEFEEHQVYDEIVRRMAEYETHREEKDKKNLEKARLAARCTHRRAGGQYCGSPRMRGSKYCYGHDRLMAARTQDMELPPLEDANAVVLGLTKGLQAMMKGQMDLKSAGMYFYAMQIVASVMGRVRFGEPDEG
jgi:DNA-binding protein H-NS